MTDASKNVPENIHLPIKTYNGARSRLPSWIKKGAQIALAGVIVAVIGTGKVSTYWEGFLQTTGALLAAAGLFMILYTVAVE